MRCCTTPQFSSITDPVSEGAGKKVVPDPKDHEHAEQPDIRDGRGSRDERSDPWFSGIQGGQAGLSVYYKRQCLLLLHDVVIE
jgi:hypothetical protein